MKKILITSIGRTGTTSFTSYLDKIPGVACFHHKIGRRDIPYLFYSQVNSYSNLAENYLINRDKDISLIDCDFYIEVNPYLRFADPKILKSLGWEKYFLVRNPKTYLESVFVRETMSKNEYLLSQMPQNDDPFSEKWLQTTRFEKLCWYYAHFHNYVLESDNSYYRFEDFINNPDALKSFVADLGIDLNKVNDFILPRQNTSFKYKFKSKIKTLIRKNETYNTTSLDWSSLTKKENDTFETLCLNLGKKMGY